MRVVAFDPVGTPLVILGASTLYKFDKPLFRIRRAEMVWVRVV